MIDITRSVGVLDPSKYTGDIHVIGVGAVGSKIVEGLILQGFNGSQIHVYDFDKVEEHNVANQLYTVKDVGKNKVDALQAIIKNSYSENIKAKCCKVDDSFVFSGVVFLLVDSFEARKKIFKALRMKPNVQAVFETRLDARAGVVNVLSSCNLDHIKRFEASLFDDGEDTSEVSVCGTRQVVAQTVAIVSGMAIWEFIKWVNDNSYIGKNIYFSTDPWYVDTEDF